MSAQCRTDRRRGDVRAARLNGVDAVEVSDDGRTLTVTFLGKAPHHLHPRNIRIDGGRRITAIRAVDVEVETEEDPELDDRMLITVDKAGDTSLYRLSVVEPDAYGRPGTKPYRGFDPRYASAEFSFGQACPTPYDCRDEQQPCAPELLPGPVIDYTARDYDSLRSLVLDRMSLTAPDWAERHIPDLGVTLVELLAYTADQLSYHQDAVATEAYLDTARRRVSVRRHVRLIDYAMHDGCNARTFIALETDRPVTLPRGEFRFAAVDIGRLDPQERPDLGTVIADEDLDTLSERAGLEIYEPLGRADFELRPEHNAIALWTWGEQECTLPKGATTATLRDGDGDGCERALELSPGDLLLLEEVLGPRTGSPADADPAHRQAVRIVSVTPLTDELYKQPVLEVAWAPEDALTFPLCLSALGGTDCALITDIGIARGNVTLVDHGRSLTFCDGAPESLAVPPEPVTEAPCGPPAFGCADVRPEGSGSADALRALLDQTRSGRQLSPGQIHGLYDLVGEDATTRAGLGIELAPGTTTEERVQPPTADAQAAALETLLAQLTYPAITPRFRPALRHAPVTQAAPYPDPAHVSAGQAALLATIPQRVRDRLEVLWRRAEDGHPPGHAETAELTVLFGARTLAGLHLADHPARALRELLARRKRLLAAKLERLEVLTARARAGAVLDRHIVWETAQSWGERYAAGLAPADPVLAGPASELARQDPRAALPAVRLTGADGEWTPRRDLLADGPRDRHFTGETEDDGRLVLRFGDGRHGAAPLPGDHLQAAYRVGSGPAGNVGAEAIGHLVICRDACRTPVPTGAVTRVRNPLPATGGTDPEAVDQVRTLAPLALQRQRLRAVTPEDYAELAAGLPGVQRAAAELRWSGSSQEMHVSIDALGTGTPDAALLQAVEYALSAYRRIGHDLVVRPAALVPLDIAVTVCAAPGYQRGHVLDGVRRALGNRGGGFFDPDALTFGDPVRLSRLVAVTAAVPGVVSARVTRLQRLFRQADGELEAGLLRIGPLEVAQCDNDPDRPENGRVSIAIGGGR